MKKKKQIKAVIIGAIAVIIILGICIFTGDKSDLLTNTKIKESTESHDPTEEIADVIDIAKSDIEDVENHMNSFDNLLIRKTVSKSIVQTEPEYSREFIEDEDIVSVINILKNTDVTLTQEDYQNNKDADLLNFESIFGFDYKKHDNIYDVIIQLAKTQEINTDFSNATFDKDLYKSTEQKVYVLNGNSTALQNIISTLDYDEILDSYVCYQMLEKQIGYINARVKYIKDEKTIFYNLHFQFAVFNEGEEANCGCGCGSVSESECGLDDCDICKSKENDEINYE